MAIVKNILRKVLKQLLPSGRAYRVPFGSKLDKLLDSLEQEETLIYNDILSVLDFILPDNDNFAEEDATEWERRLGLIISPNSTLDDRKAAILRKINHPGTQKARQNYRYIEAQLQAAGFDVYVFENRFPDGFGGYVTKTPQEVAISPIEGQFQHGQGQHGGIQHGTTLVNKIANSIDPQVDLPFDVGDNFKSTFFISSSTLGINAVIPSNRLVEFRKLVLTLKPAQTVAYAFIDISPPVVNYLLLEDDSKVLLEDGSGILIEDSYT